MCVFGGGGGGPPSCPHCCLAQPTPLLPPPRTRVLLLHLGALVSVRALLLLLLLLLLLRLARMLARGVGVVQRSGEEHREEGDAEQAVTQLKFHPRRLRASGALLSVERAGRFFVLSVGLAVSACLFLQHISMHLEMHDDLLEEESSLRQAGWVTTASQQLAPSRVQSRRARWW
eukprot:COSAG01_NODE_31781_length_590_cov_2.351626_1_plen_174_part_00